jgi:hypothetical protein
VSVALDARVAAPDLLLQLVREVREQLLARDRTTRQLVIGVRAQPDWPYGDLEGDDGPVRVVACVTPLMAREALAEFLSSEEAIAGTATLVVLTALAEHELGDDLLGRFVRPTLRSLNRWRAVCDRLKVRQLDPDYGSTRFAWMADALLSLPLEHVPAGIGTLSIEGGLAMLARSVFGADGLSLERLLIATTDARFGGRVDAAEPELVRQLCEAIGEWCGPACRLVTGTIANGRGAQALPAGLAAATVVGADSQQYAYAMVEALTGCGGITDAALAAWARAAERALAELDGNGAFQVPDLLTSASQLVTDWRAPNPDESSVLPASFDARLARLATVLDSLLDENQPADLDAVRYEVGRVRAHREANSPLSSHRATRAELAARLALWLRDPSVAAHGLGTTEPNPAFSAATRGYLDDGAWVDMARRRVEEGDDHPAELAAVLGRISEAAYERRRSGNTRFARALASWSEHGAADDLTSAPVVAVESVLERLAVPLAREERALLVVLDGCGVAPFLEFVEEFRHLGLQEIGRDGQRLSGLSVLPTVTEVSRSSLLCGDLSPGDAAHEKRGFARHPAVHALPGAPAVLFHQHQDLVTGVGQGLPALVVDALGGNGPRLVGVVINTIDDELSRATFNPGYSIANLGPLRAVLRAASDAGRYVIVTADHGHVLGVGLDGRGVARRGGEGGDRWRSADRAAEDDEVVLRGPRVLRGDDRGVIAPSQDDLRYSAKHGGYHGGATPEECLVPLSVFRPPGVDLPDGWEPVAVAPPPWWDLAATVAAEPTSPAPSRKRRRSEPSPGQAGLFDAATSGATSDPKPPGPSLSTPEAPWVGLLLASDTFAGQLGAMTRAKPREEWVRGALGALHARGGVASYAVIAQAAGLPPSRVPTFVAALERLLNVDGYGVVTLDRSAQEVRLDEGLLRAQFLSGSP